MGGIFPGGGVGGGGVGEISKFLTSGGSPPIRLTLYICIYKRTSPTGFSIQWRSFVYIIYIMWLSCHLTSARFEHFVCHRCVWYIFSLVCSVSINLSYHMFNQTQWWEKYLCILRNSLIKHPCSWRDKFIHCIYIRLED